MDNNPYKIIAIQALFTIFPYVYKIKNQSEYDWTNIYIYITPNIILYP